MEQNAFWLGVRPAWPGVVGFLVRHASHARIPPTAGARQPLHPTILTEIIVTGRQQRNPSLNRIANGVLQRVERVGNEVVAGSWVQARDEKVDDGSQAVSSRRRRASYAL